MARTSQGQVHVRSTVQRKGIKFQDVAAMLVEADGKPHTIKLCGNCDDFRRANRNDSKVTIARWKTMVPQEVSRGRLSAAFGANGFVQRRRTTCG